MPPGSYQVDETLTSDLRVEAFYKIGALRGDAPVAPARLASSAEVKSLYLVFVLLVCVGCASNPDTAGQVLSGVLMGIGTGLSGL